MVGGGGSWGSAAASQFTFRDTDRLIGYHKIHDQ